MKKSKKLFNFIYNIVVMYKSIFLLLCLCGPILGYLFGSILFAIIFSKIFKHQDIRKFGSHNPGFTNSLRTYGSKISAFVLILDMLKIIIPTIIIFLLIKFIDIFNNSINELNLKYDFNFNFLLYLTPVFGIIGHIFPIYFKFKGGKGVSSYFALLLLISPFLFVICALLLIAIVIIKKIMSIASLSTIIISPLLFLVPGVNYFYLSEQNFVSTIKYTIDPNTFLWLLPIFGILVVISLLIIYKHRKNIINIINKKEPTLSFLK